MTLADISKRILVLLFAVFLLVVGVYGNRGVFDPKGLFQEKFWMLQSFSLSSLFTRRR